MSSENAEMLRPIIIVICLFLNTAGMHLLNDYEMALNWMIGQRLHKGKLDDGMLWKSNEFDNALLTAMYQTEYLTIFDEIGKLINSEYDPSQDAKYLIVIQQCNINDGSIPRNRLSIYKYSVFIHWMQENILIHQLNIIHDQFLFIKNVFSVRIIAEMFNDVDLITHCDEWYQKLDRLWNVYCLPNIIHLTPQQSKQINLSLMMWKYLDTIRFSQHYLSYLQHFDAMLLSNKFIPRQSDYYFIFNLNTIDFATKQMYFSQWLETIQTHTINDDNPQFSNANVLNSFISNILKSDEFAHHQRITFVMVSLQRVLSLSTNTEINQLYDVNSLLLIFNACVEWNNTYHLRQLRLIFTELQLSEQQLYELGVAVLNNGDFSIMSSDNINFSQRLIKLFSTKNETVYHKIIEWMRMLSIPDTISPKCFYLLNELRELNATHLFLFFMNWLRQIIDIFIFKENYKLIFLVFNNFPAHSEEHCKIIRPFWTNFVVPTINSYIPIRQRKDIRFGRSTRLRKDTHIKTMINYYLNRLTPGYSDEMTAEYCSVFDYAVSTNIWHPLRMHYYMFMISRRLSVGDKVRYFEQWISGNLTMRRDPYVASPAIANYEIFNAFLNSYLINNADIHPENAPLFLMKSIEYLQLACVKQRFFGDFIVTNTTTIINQACVKYGQGSCIDAMLSIPLIKDKILVAKVIRQ